MFRARTTRLATRTSLALALATTFAACSGDADPTSPTGADFARGAAASASSGSATVYVVHGINGRDLGAAEALPVDVSVNGGCALSGFTFRQIAGPLSLAAGTYDIQVRLADAAAPCTGPVAIDAPGVTLAPRSDVAIVAHLTAGGAPTASVFDNRAPRQPGRANVIARHAAAFGAVDVLANGSVAFAGVENGEQGLATIRPGEWTFGINVAGTSTQAWSQTLTLRPFTTYIAYAVGTPANGTFEVVLQAIGGPRR